MSPTILVVEDDFGVAEMLAIVLEEAGYTVEHAPDGSQALARFIETDPDVVLLDVMLPGKSGFEICEEIRRVSGTPIIMLTARDTDDDVIAGLEAGADDYLTKPFKGNILLARIKARLRPVVPTSPATSSLLGIGDITVDLDGHEVRRGNDLISLTPLEFNLLATLATKPTQVFTRDMLLAEVWGYQHKADTRLVNVHVQRLRSKVEHDPDNPQIVATVRGIGYRAGVVS